MRSVAMSEFSYTIVPAKQNTNLNETNNCDESI